MSSSSSSSPKQRAVYLPPAIGARPTEEAYAELQYAFDFFNERLFDGMLKPCLITFQREKRTMGYFSAKRFIRLDGTLTDEIAMNPEYFGSYPMIEIAQTLCHEQAHAHQYHYGQPSRAGYHNKEWSDLMVSIGLIPSHTGRPGGKLVGQKMADYPEPGGRFETAANELFASGFAVSWLDRYPIRRSEESSPILIVQPSSAAAPAANAIDDGDDSGEEPPTAVVNVSHYYTDRLQSLAFEERPEGNRSNRIKYSCPSCSIGVWGKPNLRVKCADCDQLLLSTDTPVGAGTGSDRIAMMGN